MRSNLRNDAAMESRRDVRLAFMSTSLANVAPGRSTRHRARFLDKRRGLDLDLSFITDRVCAMSLPAVGRSSSSVSNSRSNNFGNSTSADEGSKNVDLNSNLKSSGASSDKDKVAIASMSPGHTFTEVVRFFGDQRFKVYNLCGEHLYNARAVFGKSVPFAEYPVARRKPPSMRVLRAMVDDICGWLDEHPQNLAVVHCSSGLGRTCVAVSCYLLASGVCKTASEALQMFARKRLLEGGGGVPVSSSVGSPAPLRAATSIGRINNAHPPSVTATSASTTALMHPDEVAALAVQSPSQRRYVLLFERVLSNAAMAKPSWELLEKPQILVLREIVMHTIPNFRIMGGCEPWFALFQSGKRIFISDPLRERRAAKTKQENIIHFPCFDISIAGDISIEFYHKRVNKKMFALSCHTSFLRMGRHTFPKRDIDGACKDRECKRFDPGFRIDLVHRTKEEVAYEKIQERATEAAARKRQETEMQQITSMAHQTSQSAAMTIDIAPRPQAKLFAVDVVSRDHAILRSSQPKAIAPSSLESLGVSRPSVSPSFSMADDACPVCKDAIFHTDDVITTSDGQTHWGCAICGSCGQRLSDVSGQCTIIDGATGLVRCPNCVAGRNPPSGPRPALARNALYRSQTQLPMPAGGVERARRMPGVTVGGAGIATRIRGATLVDIGLGTNAMSFFPSCMKCDALVVDDLYGCVPDETAILADPRRRPEREEQIRLQQASAVTNPDAVWHPACFVCIECDENVLFGHRAVVIGEDVYCTSCVARANVSNSASLQSSRDGDADAASLQSRLLASEHTPAAVALIHQRRFLTQLLCGEVIPLAQIGDLSVEQLGWLFEWAINDERLHVNEASVVALAAAAYPHEQIAGIREKILDCQLLDLFVHYASQGKIHVHQEIPSSQIEMGEEIAAGAGGVVFKALYKPPAALSAAVALKLFLPDHIAFDEFVFRRETAIASMLANPFVVSCHGASFAPENMFLLSEWMTDGSLRDIRKNRPALLEEHAVVCGIAVDVCEGMVHLHKRNIIHRDLKPDNVLLTRGRFVYVDEAESSDQYECMVPSQFPTTPYHRRCRAKLTDFGTSRSVARDRPMSGNIGTTRYIAPEMFNPPFMYDESADIYSFGILLWELLFPRDASYGDMPAYRIPDAVCGGLRPAIPPERLLLESKKPGSALNPNPHPELVRLLKQCWDLNPKLRPPFTEIQKRLIALESHLFEVRQSRLRAAAVSEEAAPVADVAIVAREPRQSALPADMFDVVSVKTVLLPARGSPSSNAQPFVLQEDDRQALESFVEQVREVSQRPRAGTMPDNLECGAPCASCALPTRSDSIVIPPSNYASDSIYFHPHCFKCSVCSRALTTDEPVGIRDSKPFCKTDYYQLWKQCDRCGELLHGTYLSVQLPVNDTVSTFHYHPHCFVCVVPNCSCAMPDGVFYEFEGNILCPNHLDLRPKKATMQQLAPATSVQTRSTFDVKQMESPSSVGADASSAVEQSEENQEFRTVSCDESRPASGSDADTGTLGDSFDGGSFDGGLSTMLGNDKTVFARIYLDDGSFRTLALAHTDTCQDALKLMFAKMRVPVIQQTEFVLAAIVSSGDGVDGHQILEPADVIARRVPGITTFVFSTKSFGGHSSSTRTPIERTPSQARISMQAGARELTLARGSQIGQNLLAPSQSNQSPNSASSSSGRWKPLFLSRARNKTLR